MLLGKFREDVTESLGMELPPLPQRPGPVKVAKLDDLTSSELDMLSDSVLVLLTRFTALIDDPLLPKLLGTPEAMTRTGAGCCRFRR